MKGKKSSPPHFRELPVAARQCEGSDALALELPTESGVALLVGVDGFSAVIGSKVGALAPTRMVPRKSGFRFLHCRERKPFDLPKERNE